MRLLSFFFFLLFFGFHAHAESPFFEQSRFANEPAGMWRWEEEDQCWFRIIDGVGSCGAWETGETGEVKDERLTMKDFADLLDGIDLDALSLSELRSLLRNILSRLGVDISGLDLSGYSADELRAMIRALIDRIELGTFDLDSFSLDDFLREYEDDVPARNGGNRAQGRRMHDIFYKPLIGCKNIFDERPGEIFGNVPCTSYPGIFTSE